MFSNSWIQRSEYFEEPVGDDIIDARGAEIRDGEGCFTNDLEGSLKEDLFPEVEEDHEEDDVDNEGLV